jgi:hypothetical protein
MVVRVGARGRTRFMISICCFMSRLSATAALVPPGPRSLATAVNRVKNQQILHGGAG